MKQEIESWSAVEELYNQGVVKKLGTGRIWQRKVVKVLSASKGPARG